MLKLKCKKLDPESKLPSKAYKGDAGIDLYSIEDVVIPAGQMGEVKTGIAVEIPEGHHLQIHTRSSHGKKQSRCHLGIIDEGYRNEISIWMFNHHPPTPNLTGALDIKKGDKICQMLLLPTPEVNIIEVDELSDSERGLKGHGSSGR